LHRLTVHFVTQAFKLADQGRFFKSGKTGPSDIAALPSQLVTHQVCCTQARLQVFKVHTVLCDRELEQE